MTTNNTEQHYIHVINAYVAHGGWVPRNLGAGAADPNPGSKSTPKACPTRNQPRAPPAIPSPSPSTRHTEPELHGNNDNSIINNNKNNSNNNKLIKTKGRGGREKTLKHPEN